MTRLSSIGLKVVLAAALLPSGFLSAATARPGAQSTAIPMISLGMRSLEGRMGFQRDAGPGSLTWTQRRKGIGMLLPAVQKIRDVSGGRSGRRLSEAAEAAGRLHVAAPISRGRRGSGLAAGKQALLDEVPVSEHSTETLRICPVAGLATHLASTRERDKAKEPAAGAPCRGSVQRDRSLLKSRSREGLSSSAASAPASSDCSRPTCPAPLSKSRRS